MVEKKPASYDRFLNGGVIVSLWLFGLGLVEGAVVVSSATNPANGHIYHLVSGEVAADNPLGGLSWSEAELFSRSFAIGGASAYLFSVTTEQEEQWVMDQFADPGVDFSSHYNLFWLGLSDRNVEGEFEWESGESSDYHNWTGGSMPVDDSGLEDYVYFGNTSVFEPLLMRGQINDHEDARVFSDLIPFSAIVEVVPIPEPLPLMLTALVFPLALRRRRNGVV